MQQSSCLILVQMNRGFRIRARSCLSQELLMGGGSMHDIMDRQNELRIFAFDSLQYEAFT